MNQIYNLVENYLQLSELLNTLLTSKSNIISIDSETTSLDFLSGRILLIQLRLENQTFIINPSKFEKGYIEGLLKVINTKFRIIGHNIIFDMKFFLKNYNVTLEKVHDTMITESILNMGIGSPFYSLEELVAIYENQNVEKQIRTEFENHDGTNFTEQQLIYSALDVQYLESIYYKQLSKIKDADLELTYVLECNLVPVVCEMEHNGVNFDKQAWLDLVEINKQKLAPISNKFIKDVVNKIIVKCKKKNNLLEVSDLIRIPVKTKRDRLALEQITDFENAREWLETNINISSHTQIKAILNEIYKINCTHTDAKTLEEHRDKEVVSDLLLIREVEKKITTYGAKFLTENVSQVTERIHTEFLQTGTVTGRFSSAHPNLQNIPREKEYRHCFISTEGWDLICADYSQQEMRITASFANEKNLIDAFLKGEDVHAYTASIIFNKDPSQITKDERYIGKTMNFAVLYGSTKYGIAYNLKMKLKDAEIIIKKFYEGFPNLGKIKTDVEKKILGNKYSSTMSGRKRYFENKRVFLDHEEMYKYFNRIKREGFNQVIQGTGADVIKLALVLIRRNNPFGKDLRILLTIHDEIVCESKKEISKEAAIFVTNMMLKAEKTYLGVVPAAVEYSIDNIWEKDDKDKSAETVLA